MSPRTWIFATVVVVVGSLAWPAAVSAQPEDDLRLKISQLKQAEPDAYETQQRALEHFRVHPDRIGWLRRLAAWKAAVPTFEVSAGGTAAQLGENTKLDEYSREVNWVERSAAGQAAEVRTRVSWDLSRLVFNAEELDVTGLTIVQRDVIDQTTRIYFLRRRLQVQLIANPPTSPEVLLERELRIEELTALLNGMTGGWFAEEIKSRAR